MKTKKFEKKLILNKKTVTNLNMDEMIKLNGGDKSPRPTMGRSPHGPFCE